ncbi:hypothetical protein BSZ15_23605, partial [Bradyrhizobium canariense]
MTTACCADAEDGESHQPQALHPGERADRRGCVCVCRVPCPSGGSRRDLRVRVRRVDAHHTPDPADDPTRS